jgi:two-component system LytT family response regulator
MHTIAETKEKKEMTSITVKKGAKIMFLKLEDISYFEATEKYVTLYTEQGSELVEQSLTSLEEKLPSHFLRIHRGFLINTHYVKEFQKYFNSRYSVRLKNKKATTIISGRSYKETIKNWINA